MCALDTLTLFPVVDGSWGEGGSARGEATIDETNYDVILFRHVSIYAESTVHSSADINEIKRRRFHEVVWR